MEINPPPPVSGTSLFSWNSSDDQEIIKNGPYEFRYVDEVMQAPTENIPPNCERFLKNTRTEYHQQLQNEAQQKQIFGSNDESARGREGETIDLLTGSSYLPPGFAWV